MSGHSKAVSEDVGRELIEMARLALQKAYVPYSSFPVACALLSTDGTVHVGVNIENASFGLTVCAERCAVFSSVAAGHRNFVAGAVVTSTGKEVMPCGACRQVLAEFCNDDTPLYFESQDGRIAYTTVGQLLPHAFRGPETALPAS
jgi:homotetrameric cytidine deaminase